MADPDSFVDWVRARRELDLGEVLLHQAHLVRWRFNGRQPVYSVLYAARLAASG